MNAHWRRNRKRDTDGRIHVNCWLCDSWQADYIGLCVDFRNNTDLSWCSWLKCDRECETCSEIDKSSQFAFVLNILVVLYNIRQHTKIVLCYWSIFFGTYILFYHKINILKTNWYFILNYWYTKLENSILEWIIYRYNYLRISHIRYINRNANFKLLKQNFDA